MIFEAIHWRAETVASLRRFQLLTTLSAKKWRRSSVKHLFFFSLNEWSLVLLSVAWVLTFAILCNVKLRMAWYSGSAQCIKLKACVELALICISNGNTISILWALSCILWLVSSVTFVNLLTILNISIKSDLLSLCSKVINPSLANLSL